MSHEKSVVSILSAIAVILCAIAYFAWRIDSTSNNIYILLQSV